MPGSQRRRRLWSAMGANKRCSHGKVKGSCAACNLCPHGKVKYDCADCNPCPHGKLKYKCKACKAARAGQPAPPEIKPDPEI